MTDDGDDDDDNEVVRRWPHLFSFSFFSSRSFNIRGHSSGHLYPFNCSLRDTTSEAGSPDNQTQITIRTPSYKTGDLHKESSSIYSRTMNKSSPN